MTKQHFKYNLGYINVDDTHLYLTNSGNWQEARESEEKSPATRRDNLERHIKRSPFSFLVLAGIAIMQLMENKKWAITLIAVLLVLAIIIFFRLKRDFGNRYKIPFNKLIAIEPQGKNGLIIRFYNALGNPDYERVKGVELKGMEFFAGLVSHPKF